MSEPALSNDDRATLVAYLDGELDADASRQVEDRIGRDPSVRAEVESMKRTWELLDYLPRVEPSPAFTHRTIGMVTVEHLSVLRTRQRRRRWLLGAAWAASILLAALGGYFGVTHLSPHQPTDEELAHDVRLLENRRAYERAGDLGFLKALDQPDLFGDDTPDAGG